MTILMVVMITPIHSKLSTLKYTHHRPMEYSILMELNNNKMFTETNKIKEFGHKFQIRRIIERLST